MKHKHRSPAHHKEIHPNEYCYVNNKKKRKYKSELDAEISAPSKELSQYICEYCSFWHNGKTSKTKTK